MKRQSEKTDYSGVGRVLLGVATLCIPVVLWFASHRIITLMAPDEPVPQGAMACYGLILLVSVLVCIPLGIYGVVTGDRIHRRSSEE